jgi:hypothetical protein
MTSSKSLLFLLSAALNILYLGEVPSSSTISNSGKNLNFLPVLSKLAISETPTIFLRSI